MCVNLSHFRHPPGIRICERWLNGIDDDDNDDDDDRTTLNERAQVRAGTTPCATQRKSRKVRHVMEPTQLRHGVVVRWHFLAHDQSDESINRGIEFRVSLSETAEGQSKEVVLGDNSWRDGLRDDITRGPRAWPRR